MSWLSSTFADGEKPSLARQLIALIVFAVLVLLTAHAIWPDRVKEPGDKMLDRIINVLESLMMWAGWSRGVTAVKSAREKLEAKKADRELEP